MAPLPVPFKAAYWANMVEWSGYNHTYRLGLTRNISSLLNLGVGSTNDLGMRSDTDFALGAERIDVIGTAAIGDTSIAVQDLPVDIPAGAILDFAYVNSTYYAPGVVVSAYASAGSTSLSVAPLVKAVQNGSHSIVCVNYVAFITRSGSWSGTSPSVVDRKCYYTRGFTSATITNDRNIGLSLTSYGAAIDHPLINPDTVDITLYLWDASLDNVYYDGEWCQMQLSDYTGDTTTYYPRADSASAPYLDLYVNNVDINGNVQGYRCFPLGLAQRFIRRGDVQAQIALQNIVTNNAYCNYAPVTDDLLSRECAYALETLIWAPLAGVVLTSAQVARRAQLKDWALGHIDQWCTSLTAEYYRPFMGGLTAKALIDYYTKISPDANILAALQTLATYTWNTCWDATAKAFNYTDRDTGHPDDLNPQADLNALICPLYGWLWYMTGVQGWRDKGDQIFEGSISVYVDGFYDHGSYLGSQSATNPAGKQYNQQLYWMPQYITWAESDWIGAGGDVPDPGDPPVDPEDPPDPEDPVVPSSCTGGVSTRLTYKTSSNLSCRCAGGLVVLCLDPARTCNGAPFIDAVLESHLVGRDICGHTQYTYYLVYDNAALRNPALPLMSSEITGALCRGCLTKYIDWKAPFFKTALGVNYQFVLPDVAPTIGSYLIVKAVEGSVITLTWGPAAP